MKIHAVLISLSLTGLACSDRQVSTNETPLESLCMIAGSMGYWLDGRQTRVHRGEGKGAPYACTCITLEQFWDEDEQSLNEAELQRLTDELSDELLLECERAAAVQGFDWNDCQADYESGAWGPAQVGLEDFTTPFTCPGEGWAGPNDPYPDDPSIDCELGEPGCSCTVQAICTGGSVCVEGMCQMPP